MSLLKRILPGEEEFVELRLHRLQAGQLQIRHRPILFAGSFVSLKNYPCGYLYLYRETQDKVAYGLKGEANKTTSSDVAIIYCLLFNIK